MIRTLFFATAAISGISTAALAGGKEVQFDRASLNEPAYVEALYAEIEQAAREVCKSELLGSPYYHSKVRSCIKASLARALADVDSPLLTAFAEGVEEMELAAR